MIRLELIGPTEDMQRVTDVLCEHKGISRVRSVATASGGESIVSAAVDQGAVDSLLATLGQLGVPAEDISLSRSEEIGLASPVQSAASMIWADVESQARVHARPVAFYLAYMVAAGIIASYGVLDQNGILIVGAMAVSPDLLPITAIAVALVAGRVHLARRALLTLAVGMAAATATAAIFAFAQDALDLISANFDPDATVLGSLTHVNDETVAVAFAAGTAGMLALETRASAAVGVAISVTTIPAAAYLGVSIGLGNVGDSAGALAVLVTNIIVMSIGASTALLVQRKVGRR